MSDYTASDSHEASALLSALRNMHCDRPHPIFGPPCERCLSTVHDALAKALCVIRAAGYAAGVKDEREACSLECEAVCPPAGLYSPGERSAYEAAVQDCAAAIRARSEGGKA